MTSRPKRRWDYLRSLFAARAIILGFSLLQPIVTQVWVSRWYQKFGGGPIEVYPDSLLIVPLVLVLASFMLFVFRWWSKLLALLACGWVLYWLGYVALRAVSLAHDLPLFSPASLRLWFIQK